MASADKYECLILCSGESGKNMTWTMAKAGHRAVMVERGLLGGACPNVACMPSKNIIYLGESSSLFGS